MLPVGAAYGFAGIGDDIAELALLLLLTAGVDIVPAGALLVIAGFVVGPVAMLGVGPAAAPDCGVRPVRGGIGGRVIPPGVFDVPPVAADGFIAGGGAVPVPAVPVVAGDGLPGGGGGGIASPGVFFFVCE